MRQWMALCKRNAAAYAVNVKNVSILPGVTQIPADAFSCFFALETLSLHRGLLHIGNSAFLHCTRLKSLELPDTVTTIGCCAFEGCVSLEQLALPDSVTLLDSGAFYNCTALAQVVLSNRITVLSDGVLGNTAIESLTVPAGVRVIDTGALEGPALRRLVIHGDAVRFFEYRLFQACPNLAQLVFLGSPPSIDNEFLIGTTAVPTVYYAQEQESLWRPNGETVWMGCPLKGIRSVSALPDAEPTRSFFDQYGWAYIQESRSVRIGSNMGWELFCRMNWPVRCEQVVLLPGVSVISMDASDVDCIQLLTLAETVESVCIPAGLDISRIEVSPDNPYLHIEDGRLIEMRTGAVLWEPPAAPHPTPYLGTPLTEEEIAAAMAAATEAPSPSPKPEPWVSQIIDELEEDGLGWHMQDGWLISEDPANSVLICTEPREELAVPPGICQIQCNFSDIPYADQVRRLVLPEGLRSIDVLSFSCFSNLESVSFPTTLEELGSDLFSSLPPCALDTLLIPRNTQLKTEIGPFEISTVLQNARLDTLVFCGTQTMFLPKELLHLRFPLDGTGRLVFWGEPPEHICLSDLYDLYRNEESAFRSDTGPFTICYPAAYAGAWSPNGETRWHSLPIRMLTPAEEATITGLSPKLFSDADRINHAKDPGWDFDLANNVQIYSEAGWAHFTDFYWGMEIAELRFAEGVTAIERYDFRRANAPENVFPTEPILADTLCLPSTVKQADVSRMTLNRIEVSPDNPYLHIEDDRLIETRTGAVLWEPPAAPHPTPYLGTPLTEEEIAAAMAAAAMAADPGAPALLTTATPDPPAVAPLPAAGNQAVQPSATPEAAAVAAGPGVETPATPTAAASTTTALILLPLAAIGLTAAVLALLAARKRRR